MWHLMATSETFPSVQITFLVKKSSVDVESSNKETFKNFSESHSFSYFVVHERDQYNEEDKTKSIYSTHLSVKCFNIFDLFNPS